MSDVIMILVALAIVAVVGCLAIRDYCKEKKAMRDEEEKESKDNKKE